MNEVKASAFHIFCSNRMITKDTEDKFVKFFEDKFKETFIENSSVTSFIMDNMPQDEIQKYWVDFVRTYKRELEESIEKEEVIYDNTVKRIGS